MRRSLLLLPLLSLLLLAPGALAAESKKVTLSFDSISPSEQVVFSPFKSSFSAPVGGIQDQSSSNWQLSMAAACPMRLTVSSRWGASSNRSASRIVSELNGKTTRTSSLRDGSRRGGYGMTTVRSSGQVGAAVLLTPKQPVSYANGRTSYHALTSRLEVPAGAGRKSSCRALRSRLTTLQRKIMSGFRLRS